MISTWISARDTSAQALRDMRAAEMGKCQREVFYIVLAAQRCGSRDMSRTEIRDACERAYGRRFDTSAVAARVSELIAAGRLAQREETRPCAITGQTIHPAYVPQRQARLFA